MRRFLLLFCLLAGLWSGLSAQLPPAPQRWVTDGPRLLSGETRERLDRRLEAYQKGTGHHVLVWIGESSGGTPLEDWTVKAFEAWKVGRSGMDDGLVLFVFTGDRKLRMEVGYGLEGVMPDAIASRIIQETILPPLKAGDGNGAITAGVERILKVLGGDASAGEPRAHQSRRGSPQLGIGAWLLIGLVGAGFLVLLATNPSLAIWLLFSILSGGRGGGGGGGGVGGPGGVDGPAAGEHRDHGETWGCRMGGLSRRTLRECLDTRQVLEAIEAAERVTSGEIRVSVAPFFWGNVEKVANKAFHRLGMDRTAERNGVLIFLVPSRRRFVVLGDAGIHASVGQAFWEEVAACLSGHFQHGRFTEGLVEGVQLVGDRLHAHFPHQGEADRNELPNDVDFN